MRHISASQGSHWLEDPEGDCPGGFYVSPAECPVCRADRLESRVKKLEEECRLGYQVLADLAKKDSEFDRLEAFCAEKDAKIAEQAAEIQALVNRQAAKDEEVERMKARLNAYYGECKPCSRCAGTGKDPLVKNCTCDCCEGTGWEVDA